MEEETQLEIVVEGKESNGEHDGQQKDSYGEETSFPDASTIALLDIAADDMVVLLEELLQALLFNFYQIVVSRDIVLVHGISIFS